MPTYQYKCTNCSHRFEARQRFSDDPLSQCPQCQGSIRRVISQVGIVFKGSGFYVTDNRNGRSNGSLGGIGKSKEGESANGGDAVKSKKPDEGSVNNEATTKKKDSKANASDSAT
jgi:putative FmdB family regulatory protein